MESSSSATLGPSSPTTLHSLLSNDLIQSHLAPYLRPPVLLSLAATSTSLRTLVLSPSFFSHLDLSAVPALSATLLVLDSRAPDSTAQHKDDGLTEDEIYSAPLRNVFSHLETVSIPARASSQQPPSPSPQMLKVDVLSLVRVLVLDGLAVTADLLQEIVTEERFAGLRVLSLRGCSHLNERRACQVLNYAVREGREGRVSIRGLYIFGPRDGRDAGKGMAGTTTGGSGGVMTVQGAQIGAELRQVEGQAEALRAGGVGQAWYGSTGRSLRPLASHWAETLQACSGIVAFDAVLCRGPRHDPGAGEVYLPPAVATVALGQIGCETCGSCPEGAAVFGHSLERELPLLAPPPTHASTVRAAQKPDLVASAAGYPRMIVRCEQCLRDRWCERCNKWWCEDCYGEPVSRNGGEGGTAKVYMNICTEYCLRGEMLAIADGMWG